MSRQRRTRDESGAVAIMTALMATMLLGVAALTVDLGQGFVASHNVQKDADFAALAGGQSTDLPTPATSANCSGGAGYLNGPQAVTSSQAVQDVSTYLNAQPEGYTTTTSSLSDCKMSNGEVVFGSVVHNANGTWTETYNKNQLSVVTPPSTVNFGFARAIGATSVNVQRQATVQIYSPSLLRTLPLYAYTGCDFGQQTIAQPSNGQAASTVNLANGSDTNAATLTSLAASPYTSQANDVAYPVPSPTSLTITGTKFTGATAVGFFESGTTAPGPAPTTISTTAAGVTVTATQIKIPDISLLSPSLAQDTWYVRVKIGGSWSTVAASNGTVNALPLTVGDPNLICSQGSSAGNFGSLLLPNPAGPSGQTDNIAYNIAAGLPHSLGIFPGAASPWTCSSAMTGAILWGPSGTDGTNCVDTKTGNVAADAAWEGFVTGVGGLPGLLTNTGSTTGCGTNAQGGAPATTVFQGYTINNDTLSCFLVNNTLRVGDVDSGATYNGPPLLSSAIYNSPRFVYVPVLGTAPSNGGNAKYEIRGFRPAFLTDQANSATQTTPEVACTSTICNGLTLAANGGGQHPLESMQLVLINQGVLPPPPDTGAVQVYSGTGQQVLRLIN